MINWISFPRTVRPPEHFRDIVRVFEEKHETIDSENNNLASNKVLSKLRDGLEELGYKVEKGKSKDDKVHLPILFGDNGNEEKSFDVDAHNPTNKTIIEVEAGRAVTNYQFLKDFFEACMIPEVEYLCIAVRNVYQNGPSPSKDFEKVRRFFNSLYMSERIKVPLHGILIIGY